MPKNTAASETRRFRIDPNAIMSLIGAQAGTLQKAILEGVANSIDAGAKRIDVTAGSSSVSISDDGKGLDREGIVKYFEVFAFDHTNLDRRIGRFGVGRGQLFCFGKNTWRTGKNKMLVDIKSNGLDYELATVGKSSPGMSITIDLYSHLTPFMLNQLEEDLRRLVRFSIVPVFFNGKEMSEDPALYGKWTEETDEAWFHARKDGQLAIYSQGLMVQEHGSYRFGLGGTVVTKPGKALRQNLARNEILVNECPVWKKVSARLTRMGHAMRGTAARTGTLTEGMRKSMALQALDPGAISDSYKDPLLDEPLFTLNNGRHVKFDTLLKRGLVAAAPPRDMKADKLMQAGVAQILDPVSFDRFGVESAVELKARLLKALGAKLPASRGSSYLRSRRQAVHRALSACPFHDTIKDLAGIIDDSFSEVATRKLPPAERAVLGALSRLNWRACNVVNKTLGFEYGGGTAEDDRFRHTRGLLAMDCATMDACTDGSQNIWINVRRLKDAVKTGLPGFQRLTGLLVHEYLHTDSSRSGHVHDHDFFEAFHNIVLDSAIAEIGMKAFATYLRSGPSPSRSTLAQVDALFDATGETLGDGSLCAAEDGASPPVPGQSMDPSPPPARRRRRATA